MENLIYFDLPIKYKELNIYPVYVKNYYEFYYFSQCLTVEKNIIPDPKVISMSNLEFIFWYTENNFEKEPYLLWFDRLLSICLPENAESFQPIEKSIDKYRYDEKGRPFFEINGKAYDSKDFDEIKKIIINQNLIELPDESISKEVRDSLEEARRYKEKLSNTKTGTLEDYIVSLAVVTGWTYDYIYSLTIRKFISSLRRLDNYIHYKIYLSSSMSGMVEFKDKSFIKHWLSNINEKDKYKDVSMDLDAVRDKVSLESAKK